MNKILDFYNGGTDHKGRTLKDILSWPDNRLEFNHDYIQWLFPLKEQSVFNKNAPIIDDETIEIFKADNQLLNKLIDSSKIYLDFLKRNTDIWVTHTDHNHLRITRMLKCLMIFGLDYTAYQHYNEIIEICKDKVNKDSIDFWKKALLNKGK